jgi:16S rRNA (guanine(966)-N(2))-methyltransferase RsmD
MRILGGSSKGRELAVPKGVATRPALARIRNSLFNILGPVIIGKRVLDLFAGTGSLGLEALSRGAGFCCFVDNSRKCLAMINQNIRDLGFVDCTSVVLFNGFKIVQYLMDKSLTFDIVFVTPPYSFFAEARLKRRLINSLEELARRKFLYPEGLIIMEHRYGQIKDNEFGLLRPTDRRSYGQTELTFLVRGVART